MRATQAEYNRRWRAKKTPEDRRTYDRERNRRRLYGIGNTEWETLFAEQGRQCAICGGTKPGGHGWHTDHDHETDQVRGILCVNCNRALGFFKDDPIRLEAALKYLEKASGG